MFTALFRRLRRLTNRPVRARRAVLPWVEALEERALSSAYLPPATIDLTASDHTANLGTYAPYHATVSADGRYAVFVSSATDLKVANFSGTLPGYREVYMRDQVSSTTTLVSLNSDTLPAPIRHAPWRDWKGLAIEEK